ncbi:MAG: ABC transporter ATP-binding protein [Gammaproteobacteria bacterium]
MIEVNNLCKSYNKTRVLDHISVKLEKGGVLVVLGPSGCGKTTFLRLLAGFERLDRGEIVLDGRLASSKTRRLEPGERHLGMIFQDLALWPHMSVFDNVAFAAGKLAVSKRICAVLVRETLNQVSLLNYEKAFPSDLSGGERQRLAIARAIVSKPDILLMDEPFNNLDPITKAEIVKLILSLKEQFNMTIIYATHNFDEIFDLAHRIVIMLNGTFTNQLTKDEFAQFNQQDLLNWYTACLQS